MPRRATKRGTERTALDRDCDVLICGASFAGLAVARELAGSGADVMVIDRYEIGERQTSACGIPTTWLTAMRLQESLRQTFGELVIHTPHTTVRYDLPWTFSTFDYRTLCAALAAQGEFAFETAKVESRAGDGVVLTDRGEIRAPLIVDALGWRRVLEHRRQHPAPRRAAVARTRSAPARVRPRPRGVDPPRVRPGRVRLEVSRRRGAADRDRLVRPALSRARADRATGARPRRRDGPLSGQLDPPCPPSRHRGRRLLRRRLGRSLPAADRRGNPHRALLRDRVRARVTARGRRRADRASRR